MEKDREKVSKICELLGCKNSISQQENVIVLIMIRNITYNNIIMQRSAVCVQG